MRHLPDIGEILPRLWPDGDVKIPGLRARMIAEAPAVFGDFGITTPLLAAHVMAQISHECGAGRSIVENLNYTAARMMQVWPSRFPNLASARPYAHDPRALANKVYNGRMGNRAGSDDGWTYRGRGAAQTTGRDGYERLGRVTGLDLVRNPDLVIHPNYFLRCGVADFVACGCLPYASADDLVGVTRKLNGGTIGLTERKVWLAKWKAALGVGSPGKAPSPDVPDTPQAGDARPSPAATVAAGRVAKFFAALAAAIRRT